MPAPENEVRISVRVSPNAPRNEVAGYSEGIFKVKIAAQPAKGKANQKLIEFLSDQLGVRKACICILKGETSHNKIVSITGLDLAEVVRRLVPQASGK